MNIQRKNLNEYRDRINAALAAEFEDEGFTIEAGAIRFSNNDFTISVKVLAVPKEEIQMEEWLRDCAILGFEEDDFGREFVSNGTRYAITGINLGRPKYPISAKRLDTGKSYKFQADGVRTALGRELPRPDVRQFVLRTGT